MYITINRDFEIIQDFKIRKNSTNFIKNKLLEFQKSISLRGHWSYIEHTSSNPTGLMQIANSIQSILGDIFCRLNNSRGYFYVNDAGLNFFIFYEQYLKSENKQEDETLKRIYTQPTKEEKQQAEKHRQDFLKLGYLNSTQKKIRDRILSFITTQQKNLNEKKMSYIYESSYTLKAKNFLKAIDSELLEDKNFKKTSEGYFYKDIRLTTNKEVPLYAFMDFIYRKDLNPETPLILLGPGNRKGHEDTEKILKKKWHVLYTPLVKIKSQKVSKRKKIDLDLNEILKSLEEKVGIYSLEVFKLWVCKYSNNSVIDLYDLLKEKTYLELKKILEPAQELEILKNFSLEVQKINLEHLEESEKKLVALWADIDLVLNIINSQANANKIFKLFQRFYYLKKQVKNKELLNVHNTLLKVLKKTILGS